MNKHTLVTVVGDIWRYGKQYDSKPIFDLAGRVAIVTGGSVGSVGRCRRPGEMGANLVLCARKKERCLQAAEELQNRREGSRTRL